MTKKLWPELSITEINRMADIAILRSQEKPRIHLLSRPALALAASVVLVVVAAVQLSWPNRNVAGLTQDVAVMDDDISDYLIYDLLDDLS
jgi:hypothetical protein